MESRKGFHLIILMSALLWGSSFPVVKVTLDVVNPFFLTSIRMIIAAVLGIGLVKRYSSFGVFRMRSIWILSGLNALGYTLQHVGMQFALASESALLININVIFVAILAAFFLNEKITLQKASALSLGVGGILILTTRGDISFLSSDEVLGQIIILLAGLVWAFYIVFTKKCLATHSAMDLSVVVIVETAIILSPLLAFYPHAGISVEAWIALLYLGFVCTALALFLYVVGLSRVGATVSSILITAEILFAVLLSVVFLDELIGTPFFLGGLLILLAIILASWSREEITPRSRFSRGV